MVKSLREQRPGSFSVKAGGEMGFGKDQLETSTFQGCAGWEQGRPPGSQLLSSVTWESTRLGSLVSVILASWSCCED